MRSAAPARRVSAALLLPALLGLAAATGGCRSTPPAEADVIVTGVRLGQGDAAGAVAIAGGRVIAAGDPAAVETHATTRTRRVDLGGARLAPGARDPYARPFASGERLLNDATGGSIYLDLVGSESEEDVVQRVRQVARAVGPGPFILGSGWDETRWTDVHRPDARLISDIVAANPVLLIRAGGGSGWANHKALEGAGMSGARGLLEGEDLLKVLRTATPLTVEERAATIETALAG